MRNIILGIGVWFFLLCSAAGAADTLYLKNGKMVRGKLMKQDQYKVTIEVNNFPRVFYHYEIERIERDQEKSKEAKKKKGVSSKKKALILRLLEANGVRQNMDLRLRQILVNSPTQYQKKLRKMLNTDEILNRLVPVYAEYYTEEDVLELINFYKGPTGQKHLNITPQIMEDTLHETVQYFQEVLKAHEKETAP